MRLVLDIDLRILAFGAALALGVTVLFGLAPATRASSVTPILSLKGGGHAPGPRRLTNALIAAQMALCVFLLFAAGVFTVTFERLLNRPLGFAHEQLVVTHVESSVRQPSELWTHVADQLLTVPGVESAAVAGWAPLTGNRWRSPVRVAGRSLQANSPHFLDVSPRYFDTLGVEVIDGRDFRSGDLPPRVDAKGRPQPGIGVVNEAFARVYFDGQNPVGRRVTANEIPMEIVGLVRDAVYFSVREPMQPTVYLPLAGKEGAALMVRTAGDPISLVASLRREISRLRPGLRVRSVEPLTVFVRQQMIRERLLATLSMFFAAVALALAAIGLYGVLNYTVVRQRREIGIRMALGARAVHVVRNVTLPMLGVLATGSIVGILGGMAFGRLVQSLLFEVRITSPATLIVPVFVLGVVAVLAAVPAAIRAVATDPALTLKTE